ncbi:hypothetical protein MBLNU459_g5651t3 [Dothideomycetes sp. NU459]
MNPAPILQPRTFAGPRHSPIKQQPLKPYTPSPQRKEGLRWADTSVASPFFQPGGAVQQSRHQGESSIRPTGYHGLALQDVRQGFKMHPAQEQPSRSPSRSRRHTIVRDPYYVTEQQSFNVGARILEGKVAIVTGASRGIGASICENLASKGASLVMNYTSDSSASKTSELAERLQREYGIKALPVQADMGAENGPAHIVSTALNHFAHPKTRKLTVDIVINNAGVASNRDIERCDAADFAQLYNVNVRGPLFLLKAVLPYLPTDRSGRVVNLSSVSASLGFAGQSVYGGTKAALEAMTRTWARELAERATVNAVNPGPVATDMYEGNSRDFQQKMSHWTLNTPLAAVREGIDRDEFVRDVEFAGGRPAYDTDVAGVVAMLCTPDSGWCTGSVICANGGMRFSP